MVATMTRTRSAEARDLVPAWVTTARKADLREEQPVFPPSHNQVNASFLRGDLDNGTVKGAALHAACVRLAQVALAASHDMWMQLAAAPGPEDYGEPSHITMLLLEAADGTLGFFSNEERKQLRALCRVLADVLEQAAPVPADL